MTHRHDFVVFDWTFTNILRFSNRDRSSLSFGGKVLVLGRYFRQILLVILNGIGQDIVHANCYKK